MNYETSVYMKHQVSPLVYVTEQKPLVSETHLVFLARGKNKEGEIVVIETMIPHNSYMFFQSVSLIEKEVSK